MVELIFELVGPYYELASAEIKAAISGLGFSFEEIDHATGLIHIDTGCEPLLLSKRLGLTHRILDHKITSTPDKIVNSKTGLELPPGTAAVDTRRVWGKKADSQPIKEGLGREISRTNKIELDHPDHQILVLISDRCYVGEVIHEIDKGGFRKREVKHRPFFSPVSLEPRYARCLINLGRPGKRSHLHDPFCGTGGILLEAGELGLEVTGGDIDEEMVEGCRENMESYGVQVNIQVGDVSKTIPKDVDLVVTDPPYGRASSTSGERKGDIYHRLFKTCRENLKGDGYLSVILPTVEDYEIGKRYLDLVEVHETKVHASLRRYYCVFRPKR
ncbi:MAG: methyltransferase [Thermoplasmata archaeon]